MHTENRRRIDIIRDDRFLIDLVSLDLDALRDRRIIADSVETELSSCLLASSATDSP